MNQLDQNILITSKKYISERGYWIEKLSGDLAMIKMSSDCSSIDTKNRNMKTLEFEIPQDIFTKLIKIVKKSEISAYLFLLSCLKILIYRYTDINDIIVCSPIYIPNRTDETLNEVVCIRDTVTGQMTFKECLLTIKKTTLEAYSNQDYPLVKILDIIKNTNEKDVSKILNISCLLKGIHNENIIKNLESDLFFVFEKSDTQLKGFVEYNENNNSYVFIKYTISHFINILSFVVENPNIKICDIPLLCKEEQQRLLGLNQKYNELLPDKTISECFEEQVKKKPNEIAVAFEGEYLTYIQLNERANQLARILIGNGVGSETIVAMITERSIEMIIGILGVLKAGGAYLPIDPYYPDDRISYMLNDSNVNVVLYNKNHGSRTNFKGVMIDLDNIDLFSEETSNFKNKSSAESLAYVIYTSGTTGNPKGVAIENRNVVNLVFGLREVVYKKLSSRLNIALLSPYVFDASIKQIFSSLLLGHSLYIVPENIRFDGELLLNFYKNNKIEITDGTPTHLKLLLKSKSLSHLKRNLELKVLLIGGEVLQHKLIEDFIGNFHAICPQIINVYGPTECCDVATVFSINCNHKFNLDRIPIGIPIPNVRIYILDKNQQLSPFGMPGEIFISGKGVGRGYQNLTNDTNKRFIVNPFVKGEIMYKTGDCGRWLEDGNIDYLGRIDTQVKIRGYRIELEEIESVLTNINQIKDAVVLDLEDENGDKYLCAYVVTDCENIICQLREALSTKLPEYMIPSYFIKIDKIPVTINGKINKNALPLPEEVHKMRKQLVLPQSETEYKLVSIWEEILNLKPIGVNDNFFELGGHSLKAMTLMSRIFRDFNVEVSLSEIFKKPILRELAVTIEELNKSSFSSIEVVEEKPYYSLSSAQKRMLIINKLDELNTNYNMPIILTIRGELDENQFKNAIKKIINRHESFRTSFEVINGEPIQKIHTIKDFHIPFKELEEDRLENEIQEFIKPFDLSKAPLIRVQVIKIHNEKHMVMIDTHHIVFDGISASILLKEFALFYEGKDAPALKIQYKDFAEWQNKMIETEKVEKQGKYWVERFAGEIPKLNLPTDYSKTSRQYLKGNTINVEVDTEILNSINKLALETSSTVYMVLLAAYNVFLSKYSNQEDIIIGTPIAGRTHTELKNIVGMFVNTLAMRNFPKKDISFISFLQQVKTDTLNAFENQDYQLEKLVSQLQIERDTNGNTIFNTIFAMENLDYEEINIQNLKITFNEVETINSKVDLILFFYEQNKKSFFKLQYNTGLFKESTAKRMLQHFITIIKEIILNTEKKLSEIEMISEEEKKCILNNYNNTTVQYPYNKTIVELFERQVEEFPENIAIISGKEQLTYKDLNEKTNQLARLLRKEGIINDCLVGIKATYSLEMVIGILAIIKAGGAYLPIDFRTPKERIKYILEESKAHILLTQKSFLKDKFPGINVINLEDEALYTGDASNLEVINTPNDLAYTIYTSGSTGNPKGVMIEHRNVVRLVKNMNYVDLSINDRVLQTCSIAFDVSTFEIWGSLLNGLTLVQVNHDVILNTEKLKTNLLRHNITILWLTSPLFDQHCQQDPEMFRSLKYLLIGGDILNKKSVEKVRCQCPNVKIINGYGPTENTTFSTCFHITEEYENSIPIGKPINNSTAYIVDENATLQPIGIPGELWVGGDGVARGYLNNTTLTNEKFIPNPFKIGDRIYKTGDIARWLDDGNIDFIGRKDHQIKIRGFRVEIEEIENILLKHPLIKEIIILAKSDANNDKCLIAYFIAEKELTYHQLKKYLFQKVPNYMVPSYFIQLEKMPLNKSGKVNRSELPLPSIVTNSNRIKEEDAPSNDIEEKLVVICKEIIGIESIGINDNFFDCGGHSLKAMMLVTKMNKEFNIQYPLRKIFEAPTIKEISKNIKTTEKNIQKSIQHIEDKEFYPASIAQKRFYVLSQVKESTVAYNISSAIIVEGEIDLIKFENVIKELVKRHESLRTTFDIVDGQLMQRVNKEIDIKIKFIELDESKAKGFIEKFIRPFDLTKDSLLRIGVIKLTEHKFIFIFDMHHIIADGVSMGILIKEFSDLYNNKCLPKLKMQYRDFSVWQDELVKSGQLKKQEEYWLDIFSKDVPTLNIPIDYLVNSNKSFQGDRVIFQLGLELTTKLKREIKNSNVTLFMALLATYNVLLSKYCGQEDIVIGSPIAGRRHADLENVIGVFINTLPIRSNPVGNKTFKEFLNEVKNNCLNAFENQDYQVDMLIEKLQDKRTLSSNKLFNVMFSFINMDIPQITLEKSKITPYSINKQTVHFDLILGAEEKAGDLIFYMDYSTKLFRKETIKNLLKYFVRIINTIVNNQDIMIKDIELLDKKEKEEILEKINNIKQDIEIDFMY